MNDVGAIRAKLRTRENKGRFNQAASKAFTNSAPQPNSAPQNNINNSAIQPRRSERLAAKKAKHS